jgi:hypothetical protein
MAVLAGFAGTLALAAPSQASFHVMQIREVYSGTATNSSYLVLQMYESGQNFVSGHSVTIYNSSASSIGNFAFSGNVSNGQNQRTILVGDDGVNAAFGLTPDLVSSSFNIPASGGAACFETIDCVAWGNFSGSVLSPVGTPVSAGGITGGMAVRRTITGGSCTNQLDLGDDTNSSLADFTEQAANPRNNASTILEGATCSPPAQTDTSIGTKPPTRTNSTSASFTFTGSPADPGITFECRLDNEVSFTSCSSPKNYSELAGGAGTSHTFRVRAIHPTHGTDTTPATYTWTIDTVAPTATINTKPTDPSPGKNVSFTFQSDESGSSFQCSLAEGADPDNFVSCSSPRNYSDLPNGSHTFKVRATDQATNQGTAASYTWTVDNSLVDETPPETTILNKPPDPSASPVASFTYSSNEPGSTFECKLDSGAFASCSAAGKTYEGLGNGSHTFQARAKDESGNVDATPAGYSWSVSVPDPIDPPPVIPPQPPPPPPPAAPETTITLKPKAVTRDRTPTFRFRSNVGGAGYQCKLDRGGFKRCSSPFTTKKLTFGRHKVQVRAVANGSVDPTPARSSFKVAKPKKKKAKRKRSR